MLLPMIVAALALGQDIDTWTLKPSFEVKDPKQVWATIVDAQAGGQGHHAVFQLTRVAKSKTAEKTVVTYNWEKLSVDDQEGESLPGWDLVVGPQGQLLKGDGSTEDDYRRMLSPLVFVYPEKPVVIGDKWNVEVKPEGAAKKLSYSYEAKSKETVEGVNTLIVAMTLKEDGDNAISGTGNYWISKVGKLVKFEVKLTNWVVPMAGADAVTDVVIRAKAQ
jgi:hypothetical protein